MLALLVGTLLAVGALAYVLFPLLRGSIAPVRPVRRRETAEASEHDAVVALREIEFDRATGKLSDADYDELRARYTQIALAALRATDRADIAAVGAAARRTAVDIVDPDAMAEAAILASRARLRRCSHCGPRPEPEADYCSGCGLYLAGACGACGAAVTEAGAAFCASCGRQLAA